MLTKLLNKLQGKTWGARCNVCQWHAGRHDLTEQQAMNRASLHAQTAQHLSPGILTLRLFRMITVY